MTREGKIPAITLKIKTGTEYEYQG